MNLSTRTKARAGILLAAMTVTTPALAHPGGDHIHGLLEGFAHPFSGLDHLFAMLAVGLWAAQHKRSAMWVLPLAFPAMMVAGAIAGMGGVAMPGVETAIGMSVVILGLLVAFAVRLPLAASTALVSACAFAHGYAHGLELPGGASAAGYLLGFVAATFILHLLGLVSGMAGQYAERLARWGGAGIAATGAFLMIGAA